MPTLLQINVSLNKGSTGRIAEQIGALARNKGWETYIVHGARYKCNSEMYSIQSVSLFQEREHAIKSFLFDAQGLGSAHETEKVIDKIKKIKPDIIHLHNIHGYFLNYKVLFSYLRYAGIPVIWTLHDCWAMTGHCVHFDALKCDKWKTECYACPAKKMYPKSILFDRSKYNYRLKREYFTSLCNLSIVPVSHWLGHIVEQSYLNKYPIHVICNGVDVQVFRPIKTDLKKKLGVSKKTVLLGVATSWNKSKGLYDYVKLSQKLSEEYIIILIGIKRNDVNKIPSKIMTVERTNNQEELVEYYSMADIVLNLSYEESFGLTTVEGLACGTPSIVYDRTASPELVTPQTGCVIEAGNIEGILDAINRIKLNGKEYYSNACRKRVLDYYNKDEKYEEYIRLYNSLLSK